jgi:hypothetical protein
MTSFIPKFCNDFACVEALAPLGISKIPKESNKTISFLYIKIPFLEVNLRTRIRIRFELSLTEDDLN